MKWRTDNPPVAGKYLVETKTIHQGRIQRFESNWNGKSWSFTNQLFNRWCDETVYETVMVAIPTDYTNARFVCNLIENQEYKSMVALRNQLDTELGVDYEDEETDKPVFFSLTDFMEECNDQYLNMEKYFISYVKIIKK
jgi:hypothetical protein